jgi:hypothetical protein
MAGMSDDDDSLLAGVRAYYGDTRTLQSGRKQQERECAVCRAFLRAIGKEFENGDVRPELEQANPGDVRFRDARFQVRDDHGGRRIQDEWKRREPEALKARRFEDLGERNPDWSKTPMSGSELADAVADWLTEKSIKYDKGCADLDALVYADITDSHVLAPSFTPPDGSRLDQQGWRSVSVLFPPYGIVLLARDTAPAFLRARAGQALSAWSTADLFDL